VTGRLLKNSVGLGEKMKTSLTLLAVLLFTSVAYASEIMPPDMRVPGLVQQTRKSDKVTELWGVDYEQILKSDGTMTKERVFALLKSIDPDKIKLAEHEHLATAITMLEPKQLTFTFKARDSNNTKGPAINYYLITLKEGKSNNVSEATGVPSPQN
jgi:hypothetical protein